MPGCKVDLGVHPNLLNRKLHSIFFTLYIECGLVGSNFTLRCQVQITFLFLSEKFTSSLRQGATTFCGTSNRVVHVPISSISLVKHLGMDATTFSDTLNIAVLSTNIARRKK